MTMMLPAEESIDTFLVKALAEAQCLEAVVRARAKVVVKVDDVLVLDAKAERVAETRREAEVAEATVLARRHRRNWTQRWLIILAETTRRPQSPATSKMRPLLRRLQLPSPKHKLRPTTST